MNKEPLVSIIIPAYNAETFIEKGIDSVLHQSYKNIEIVIVDDGSKDKTSYLIENKYACFNNIKLFKQNNFGVSIARNKGLELAAGDYCLFLDADDWMEDKAIEKLLKYNNLYKDKFVICDYYSVKNNGIEKKCNIASSNIVCEKTVFFIKNFNKYYLPSACFKLFNLSIIKKNNITFPDKIKHGEDGLFVFRYLQHISDIVYIPDALWNILNNPNSATHTEFNSSMLSGILAYEMMLSENKRYKTKTVEESLRKLLFKRINSFAKDSLFSSKTTEYDRIFLHHKLKHCLKYSLNHKSFNRTEIFALLYMFCPNLLRLIFKINVKPIKD